MSLVGQKTAVVSLGMSCQTTVQLDDHAELIARAVGDATLKPSSMLFDNIVCHPSSAVTMLRTDTFLPASKDELKLLRGALWMEHNVYFRHECTLRKSHPIEYLTGRVNLSRGYRDLAGKFAHLAGKFRKLSQLERLIFVMSNTQNDLTYYHEEAGIEPVVSSEAIEQLCDATDQYFGRRCEYVFVTYDSRLIGMPDRAGLNVIKLVPDSSEWAGDHAQWRTMFERCLSPAAPAMALTSG